MSAPVEAPGDPGRTHGQPHTLAVPTAVYVGVTLGMPGINGGFARPGFWLHAAWVLGVCLVVGLLLAVASRLARRVTGA